MKALDLKQSFEKGIKPIYIVKGDDQYLNSTVMQAFEELVDKDFRDFNLVVFDGLSDFQKLKNETLSMPMMAEYRVVIFNGCKNANVELVKKISDLFQNPASGVVVVLFVLDDSFKGLYNDFETVDCEKLDSRAVSSLINEICRLQNFSISTAAVTKLGAFTNYNMSRISNELEKLFAYCSASKTIEVEDVLNLVSPEGEVKAYELANALAAGKNKQAIEILSSILLSGEKPSALLSMLLSQYRRIFHTSISDKSDAEIASFFKVKPFSITSARSLAKDYTQIELKKIVDRLVELEYGFKSGRFSEEDALRFCDSLFVEKGRLI
jgi:DNA polymerase-3 subunit delta